MVDCYLIMTSETRDRLRPCLFVAVAEDEADAIDAFVRGFSDYMAPGEAASIRAPASRLRRTRWACRWSFPATSRHSRSTCSDASRTLPIA